MNDRWFKPDFQEIGVAGECTAYAGTQENGALNARAADREMHARASHEDPQLSSSERES